jgi:hypothetical protein
MLTIAIRVQFKLDLSVRKKEDVNSFCLSNRARITIVADALGDNQAVDEN